MASDYPCGILDLRLLITPVASSNFSFIINFEKQQYIVYSWPFVRSEVKTSKYMDKIF
jgi:hypothetical protein